MKFEITSEVTIKGIGKVKHKHEQEFSNDINVFGRALAYRNYMRKTFPNCEFEMISTKQIDDK